MAERSPRGMATIMAVMTTMNVPTTIGQTPYLGSEYPGDHSVSVKNSTMEISEKKPGSGWKSAMTIAVVTATETAAAKNRTKMMSFSP